MLPITGYTDRLSVAPGEKLEVKVSSEGAAPYDARLVRVVCGDPNPAGPGLREHAVEAVFAGPYPSRRQAIAQGSYGHVADPRPLDLLDSFTVVATIWPTAPAAGEQGLVSRRDGDGRGFVLGIGPNGAFARLGMAGVEVDRTVRPRAWYRVWASYDAATGVLAVGQAPVAPAHGVDEAGEASAQGVAASAPAPGTALLLAAAHVAGAAVGWHYNGKLEAPAVAAEALARDAALELAAGSWPGSPVAAWDFSIDIPGVRAFDTGGHRLHADLVNLPARAMMGVRWDGSEPCWRHAPAHYGAIHFHDTDLYDCHWETDFTWTVPSDLPSGVYAIRLACEGAEDMLPFVVRPPRGRPGAKICVLLPTFTYVIYANHARANTNDAYRARVAEWPDARPWTPDEHPEYGRSTYNVHSDGSGICYSSRMRPIISMRSGFFAFPEERGGSGLRHFPADTHLLDWLEAMGHEYDVVTDEDLHAEGAALLEPYRAVLTTTHPEYHTRETWDAVKAYTETGGNLMYLGGNGFYWRIAVHRDLPGVVEIRRGEGGIRAWASEPGEYYNSFDGGYGGLWRRNGRPPQAIVGVGFSAQGTFEGSYYRKTAAADDPRVAWIFEGIEDTLIGDFGLSGHGAAGFELDRHDARLGSPPGAVVVASSEGHSDNVVLVPEEYLTHLATVPGEPPEALIRADMTYFETAGGGAVFSVGSIAYCGSLAHDDYRNNVSRLTDNVLRRFRDGPG